MMTDFETALERAARDRLTPTALESTRRHAYLSCAHRRERIGRRECPSCRGPAMRDVYACELRSQGVTIQNDCRKCPDVAPAELTEREKRAMGRRAICLVCEHKRIEGGRVGCTLCNCSEPFLQRPWW